MLPFLEPKVIAEETETLRGKETGKMEAERPGFSPAKHLLKD
jgi:hypothetical protein